ncbi:hypothetical protein FOMPIDRAFT_1030690 [Fomitopsis schrenkii]|uniref:Uncharacterized protein n=1 Tax=Fomitopsis schrenkii TaxID=2126942 RepID=S8E3V0_FOMSC|nr:hypothetical protein FOMPIDRAFT_1030690 [Fomitopsis schrenkii]
MRLRVPQTWSKFLLYLLVAWLHTACQLAFPACRAVLVVMGQILAAAGIITERHALYISLASVLASLGVEPVFQILPVCPSCLEVYPGNYPRDLPCRRCASPLFSHAQRHDRRQRTASSVVRPLLQFPMKSIEAQLREILAVPGMEELVEGWRTKSRAPGTYQDNFDGRICRELQGPDGRLFFENPLPTQCNELRIGLTLGVDWFSYLRSNIAPSHSSCPMSFNIVNLPHYLRYRTANMILAGIMPGPKEQDFDEVQRYMRVFVNELLRLWREGFIIRTPKHPLGRLVRVILICVCCDKPAAHKLGGFGSHSHTFFCTRCWIKQSQKACTEAFKKGAFPARTHAEQLKLAEEYARCTTQAARDEFVKNFASRWCELARLPYFDVCQMIVIDPMHNLLLGLVKTHFYHIWIQLKVLRKTKELRRFHEILSKLQIPAYMGRLPALMGQPAGGSLTADQWLIAATVVCPIALPQIWDEYCTGNAEAVRLQRLGDFQMAAQKRKEDARKKRDAARAAAASGPSVRRSTRKRQRTARAAWVDELDDEGDEPTHPNLHPDDPAHFFKLTRFLKLVLAVQVTDQSIDEAELLIREYGTNLLHLYGPDVIRPNHHYATDVPECIRDFGPLHGFWTFLFERMNKVLKAYNTANHAGGELEVSFFREFHRTVQQSRVMATAYTSNNINIKTSIDAMYQATADDRGTVQALAREVDQESEDGGVMFSLSQRGTEEDMEPLLYEQVLWYVRVRGIHARSHLALGAGVPLLPTATFFDYVVVSQHRYWASSRNSNNANSLAAIAQNLNQVAVGELLKIVALAQPQLTAGVIYLGVVRWLVPVDNAHSPESAWSDT